jgi:hypothetical protein
VTPAEIRARSGRFRPRIVQVDVPEDPGVPYFVRGLNGRERSILISKLTAAKADGVLTSDADIVVLGLCAEDGERVFSDSPEDLAECETWDGQVLSRLSLRIVELAGLTAKAAENAEKN